MGIPKFYRWISERYPCLSEKIREYQIPEFDNLYLDMNGIIHNCSHPNDEDVHLRIPEKTMFHDIFHYIDFLFKMIKPRKVFFMAIDGVAPRAKMNQQRGRRFRSAKLAEDQEAEAKSKGEALPEVERFDSNCITPGTEFMARLHEQLKYFVQVKVSTDPLWQREGLVIYLSGHDVPGEGEHKIMDFIRHIRSKPDYEPETRHCLYGLDADLIMLGLSTHELRFSLLREEVKFSKPRKNKKTVQKKGINLFLPSMNGTTSNADNDNHPPNVSVLKPPTWANQPGSCSFAEMLAKKAPEEKKVAAVAGKNENSELLPPGPDDDRPLGSFRAPLPEKTTFLLLHLSLLRDYIDEEFTPLKKSLENHPSIEYDLEKIIDDWILMAILVGNDFVPHLPHLHIVKGALFMLYQTYMEVLPTLDGYLNENGILRLDRFESFITKLSQFDIEVFKETYDNMEYKKAKTGKNITLGPKMFEDFDFDGHDSFEEEELEVSNDLQDLLKRTEEEVFGELEPSADAGQLNSEIFLHDETIFTAEDSDQFRTEFLHYKRNYYEDKFEITSLTKDTLEGFVKEYVRAIQWVLLYYYKGVSSWGWYYPSHYAPFCTDIRNFRDYKIEFEQGKPFKPFQQLLGVLPSQSKKLLPKCYQWLMTENHSPIVDYYPEKFQQDLNGKKQDWEAVVVIPFIDELRLLEAMDKESSKLTPEEIHRNSRGSMIAYSYTSEDTGIVRCPRNMFPPLSESHVVNKEIYEVTYDPNLLPKGLHPKAKVDEIYQGFPTLKSIEHTSSLEKEEIRVFEQFTREESMVLNLEDVSDDTIDVHRLATRIIDKYIWVNWPHLTYAKVTAVASVDVKYYKSARTGFIEKDPQSLTHNWVNEFHATCKGVVDRHMKFKGIKLGPITTIIYAKMMVGRKVVCGETGKISFDTLLSNSEQPFSLKTSIIDEKVTEIFYLDKALARTFVELYPKGSQVFYLGQDRFGALGTVVKHDEKDCTVTIKLSIPSCGVDDRNVKEVLGLKKLKSTMYYPQHAAATKCQITSHLLSRITGTILVLVEKTSKKSPKKRRNKKANKDKNAGSDSENSGYDENFPPLETTRVNVGLDMKSNKKNLEVRGYTSKRDGSWHYSNKAIDLVRRYVETFRDFVRFMEANPNTDVLDASVIFGKNAKTRIEEMQDWIDNEGIINLDRVSVNTKLLDDEDICTIWYHFLEDVKGANEEPKVSTMSVKPNLLFKPGVDRGCVVPVRGTKLELLDRVTCVDIGAPVPIGRKGTIVGIQTPQSEFQTAEEAFKSTGVTTLITVIVLCDPVPDVFEKPVVELKEEPSANKLSATLASMLNINGESNKETVDLATTTKPVEKLDIPLKPKLVKFYPYQLINLTHGPPDQYSRPSSNVNLATNRTDADAPSWPPKPKNFNGSVKNGDIKILRRDNPGSATSGDKSNTKNNIVDLMSMNLTDVKKPNVFTSEPAQGSVRILKRPETQGSTNLPLSAFFGGNKTDVNPVRHVTTEKSGGNKNVGIQLGGGDANPNPLSKMLFDAQKRHDASGSSNSNNITSKVKNELPSSTAAKVQNPSVGKSKNALVNSFVKTTNVTTSEQDPSPGSSSASVKKNKPNVVKPNYSQAVKQTNVRPLMPSKSNRNVALEATGKATTATTNASTPAAKKFQKNPQQSATTTETKSSDATTRELQNSLQSLLTAPKQPSSSTAAVPTSTVAMQNTLLNKLTTAQSKNTPITGPATTTPAKIPSKLHNMIFMKSTNAIRAQTQAPKGRPPVPRDTTGASSSRNALLDMLQNPKTDSRPETNKTDSVSWTGHGRSKQQEISSGEEKINPFYPPKRLPPVPASSSSSEFQQSTQLSASNKRVGEPPSPPMFWVRHGETVPYNPQQHNVPVSANYISSGPVLQPTPQMPVQVGSHYSSSYQVQMPLVQMSQPTQQPNFEFHSMPFVPPQPYPPMPVHAGFYGGFGPQPQPYHPMGMPIMYPSGPANFPHAFVPLQVDRARAFTTTTTGSGHPFQPQHVAQQPQPVQNIVHEGTSFAPGSQVQNIVPIASGGPASEFQKTRPSYEENERKLNVVVNEAAKENPRPRSKSRLAANFGLNTSC